jgi:hypothetical protein
LFLSKKGAGYEVSSKSGDECHFEWPTYGFSQLLKMTASSVFKNGAITPVLIF